jgi:N-acetyl-gamma-glutamyl-phosphate reductase
MSFSELNENIRAYKVGRHQHIPEIESVLGAVCGSAVSLSFVPHLVPLTRGIYTTIHAGLTAAASSAEILDLYETFYGAAPFVRIRRETPQIQWVARTNYCDIGLVVEERTGQLIVCSVIDNLVKGAAGQAIQNMNLMFGLPEQSGLL